WAFWRGAPEFVQEPVSPHVKEQAELIGLPAVAGGAVGARVELHVLDEILHAPACAIDLLVEDFCPAWQVGDDEAYVAALLARLDAGDDLAGPAGRGIAGLAFLTTLGLWRHPRSRAVRSRSSVCWRTVRRCSCSASLPAGPSLRASRSDCRRAP